MGSSYRGEFSPSRLKTTCLPRSCGTDGWLKCRSDRCCPRTCQLFLRPEDQSGWCNIGNLCMAIRRMSAIRMANQYSGTDCRGEFKPLRSADVEAYYRERGCFGAPGRPEAARTSGVKTVTAATTSCGPTCSFNVKAASVPPVADFCTFRGALSQPLPCRHHGS